VLKETDVSARATCAVLPDCLSTRRPSERIVVLTCGRATGAGIDRRSQAPGEGCEGGGAERAAAGAHLGGDDHEGRHGLEDEGKDKQERNPTHLEDPFLLAVHLAVLLEEEEISPRRLVRRLRRIRRRLRSHHTRASFCDFKSVLPRLIRHARALPKCRAHALFCAARKSTLASGSPATAPRNHRVQKVVPKFGLFDALLRGLRS
jgi:hypothetical protein